MHTGWVITDYLPPSPTQERTHACTCLLVYLQLSRSLGLSWSWRGPGLELMLCGLAKQPHTGKCPYTVAMTNLPYKDEVALVPKPSNAT